MRIRTTVDGSLQITIEVEPKDAQAAFSLFGKPGAPMAIAALKYGYTNAEPPKSMESPPKEKRGDLCLCAVQKCKEPIFWDFLNNVHVPIETIDHELLAKLHILTECGIQSRRELDTDADAKRIFNEEYVDQFREWLAKQF